MKKILVCMVTLVLCLCCCTSCAWSFKKNKWYSEKMLAKCLVPELPELEKDYINRSSKDVYVMREEREYDAYLHTFYAYLLSKNFAYLGTRGELQSSLSGAFSTYYFQPADAFNQFYDEETGTYRFVYSDGKIANGNGEMTFCIISFRRNKSVKTLEYARREFAYNVVMELRFNSEAPMGGRYVLHEHTGKWIQNESTHYYQYTCGCPSPDIAQLHINYDADLLCDVCGYFMEPPPPTNHFLRNQAGCEWLNEINAEGIAEIKMIDEAVGVAPGTPKNISSSTDEAVIAKIFEEYYWLDTAPISKTDGQIYGGSGITVKFVLKDGTEKKLYINNGNYLDTNGDYFELLYVPKFEEGDSATKAYGFSTYIGTGTVYDDNNNCICEIPIDELEFIITGYDFEMFANGYDYCINTEFGKLYLVKFEIIASEGGAQELVRVDYYFIMEGDTEFCYRLVGKNLDDLIREYSVTAE